MPFLPIALLIATTMTGATPASAPINEWCPVLTDQKADPEITTVYQGRTIAFCCDRCLAKFKADPGNYLAHLPSPAGVTAPADMADDALSHEGDGGHEHSQHQHDTGEQPGTTQPTGQLEGASVEGDQHAHAHEGVEERPPLLGRFHPVIVHSPVAGIPLAFLGFLIWVMTGRDAFAKADAIPLFVGTAAAVLAVITGNTLHDSMRFSPSEYVIVERHQFMGTTAMILGLVLSAFRLWRWNGLTGRWRWAYGGGLFAITLVLGVTGYLGGSLVFGPDHLKW